MAKVNVKGTIVRNSDKWIYDWLEIEATAPQDIDKAIKAANGEKLEVEINSGGGEIFAGSEIYSALRSYKGGVKISIVGLAGSAASVIAMAGESEIAPTGMIMIHNVSTGVSGDKNDMQKTAETLSSADKSVASAYVSKTGKAIEEVLEMMNKETWLSAEDAKAQGFVDAIMFENSSPIKSLYNGINCNILSDEMLDKMRDLKAKEDKLEMENKLLKLKRKEVDYAI